MKKAWQCDEAPPTSEAPPSCPSGILGEEEPGGRAGDWTDSSGNGVGSFWEGSGESADLREGPQEGRPYHARLLQLLSTPRKRSGSASERPHPPTGPPAAWASLSGLRVMGSFKKLRSSVLQGIQNRGLATANQDAGPGSTANQDTGRDGAANQDMGQSGPASQHSSEEEQRMSNGLAVGLQGAGSSPEASDEEGGAEGGGLQRNSRCSRSIRMAYGVGRIPLQHAGAATANGGPSRGAPGQHAPPPAPSPAPGPAHAAVSAKVLSRLSRSADNLHLFRSPFKRKPPSQPGPEAAAGPLNIKRAASASSVAPRGQSPLRASGRVRKLDCAGSGVPQGNTEGHSHTSLLQPQGALCQQTESWERGNGEQVVSEGSEPSPEGGSEATHPTDTATLGTPLWGADTTTCSEDTPTSDTPTHSVDSPTLDTATPDSPISDSPILDTPTPGTPTPGTPTAAADPPVSPADPPRRRGGRARPRPLSDYGQLASRKFSIPEEEVGHQREEPNGPAQTDCGANGRPGSGQEDCSSGGRLCGPSLQPHHRKRRPSSVIGGVDLYPSSAAEERVDSMHPRPPVPSHQVPPYRAVSARLRPCPLSQSTPIGLDRLGSRPRLHRILSDAGAESSGVLDDSVSEEDGSFDELSDVTPYLQPGTELSKLNEWIASGQVVYAEALWDHVTMEEQELAFKAGDVIRVLDASNKDWWWGVATGGEAWFPSSFVRVRVNQEDAVVAVVTESAESRQEREETQSSTRIQSSEHRDQMRTNVVNEIMNTERVYIKHLKDICEGYLRQCRKHTGMFTPPQLSTIFSNIEEIYRFQRRFLKELERKYNKEEPHKSEIGSCFLLQQEEFGVYSEYCNNHPRACSELQRLMKLRRYRHFFEACRLLQQMIDISIAGFLLTPVQKICKYPLQLGELLKYTPPEHRDHSSVHGAYEAMRKVARLINERKRRLESVDTIAHWQAAILRWEGEDVLSRSSELIHSGELTRVWPDGRTQQRVFFLFDHQMVFCKKDVLRRDLLQYRGRLRTDGLAVRDLPDGRDAQLGLALKHAFRLRDPATREEWTFCARKAQDKPRWLQAFADERRRVQEDQEMGMEITESQRKQAILNARKSKRGKLRSLGYAGCPAPHQPLHPLHQRHVTVPTSIPQQPVFSLAEPRRKPSHLWSSLARHALFRK
ncbi:hypothetical protein MATL_G00021770 [Megalops atlanticus]|uniref:Spermatogenesis-associated protein 13 n=1 Tax=Megalops atlanticus TaxID=7932 RepID=A0A9D3QB77_MEGAT|nr:hypothetical protein MATL_G00021770 [Megalops atlanticus]